MSDTVYELEPTPAGLLRQGDRILHPDLGVFTIFAEPLRLRPKDEDPYRQWVTLVFTERNAAAIEVHEGDYFDKVIGISSSE